MIPDPHLELFFDYLRFPSISARPDCAAEVRGCADWLCALLASWSLEAEVHDTLGAPVVLARTAAQPDRPTVLLYGHYDVQPVEPLDLWQNPPFEPAVRDGFVFARGATDNKGQTFSHLLGLRRLLKNGGPACNVTILLEGEEEIGSPHLETFIAERRETLACDVALISDTSLIATGWPALTLGLRGIACFEIEARGPALDLHSGMFGSATPNPALALSRVLGRLHDSSGRIAIPGFYDSLLEVPELERSSWSSLPWNESWFESTTGIFPSGGERDRTVLERVWSRPTAEINGLTSGHQGPGSKTIIPSRASAKVSFRLVPGQAPDEVATLVVPWFQNELAAEGVTPAVSFDHGGLPFYTPPDSPCIQSAAKALAVTFGRPPAFTREGLSIPVAAILARQLHAPVVLAGLGLPDCQAHAPNESYPLAHLELGAQLFPALLQEWAQTLRS